MVSFGYTLSCRSPNALSQFFISLYYLTLPCLTLGLLLSGIFERIVRVNLRKTLQSEYVEAARARGIQESTILFSHALKNALIPVITVMFNFCRFVGRSRFNRSNFFLAWAR